MDASGRSALLLSVALVVLGGCERDNKPVADPLDDPWVDAIEAEEDADADAEPLGELGEAATAAVNADPSAGEPQPLALAEAPTPGQPPTGVLATPSKSAEPAASHDSGTTATAPATPPGQPTGEAEAVEGQAASAPSVEPMPTPSTAPAEPPSPPPIISADFQGSYRYTGGSSQRDDLTEALEATVDALPGAIRGIARRRLTATNPVETTVDIVVAGDTVTTTFESGFHASCVIDGGTAKTTDIEGGKLDVRLRWKAGKLVQQMQGRGGARTVVYTLSADRKKLTVHHKITSDRLPVPLIYRFSYSRK